MWLAKNRDSNFIWIFSEKPTRNEGSGIWYSSISAKGNISYHTRIGEIRKSCFDISWEDEPLEIEMIQKKYKLEDIC